MALSEAAKRIGDRNAFPWVVTEDWREYSTGMTYRQWLIGQALAGGSSIDLVDHALEFLAAEASDSCSVVAAAE